MGTPTMMMSTSSSSSSSLPLVLLQKTSLMVYKPPAVVVFLSGKQDQSQLLKKMFMSGEVHLRKKMMMPRLRASAKNLVFEDKSQGIICYENEAGEVICEGYDEGPRLEQTQTKSASYNNSRDVDIIEVLQQSNQRNWNQMINNGGSDSIYAYKGPKDVTCNGFNF